MVLSKLNKNQTAVIESVKVGDKLVLKRLYDIGVRVNAKIKVIDLSKNTAILLIVDGRLITVSYELGKLIVAHGECLGVIHKAEHTVLIHWE